MENLENKIKKNLMNNNDYYNPKKIGNFNFGDEIKMDNEILGKFIVQHGEDYFYLNKKTNEIDHIRSYYIIDMYL